MSRVTDRSRLYLVKHKRRYNLRKRTLNVYGTKQSAFYRCDLSMSQMVFVVNVKTQILKNFSKIEFRNLIRNKRILN